MKRNDVKAEVVVRTEYVAEDGTVFKNEDECRKYEESALFAVKSRLKKLNSRYVSIFDLYDEGSEDDEIEIFDVQTEEDLELLRRYVYLELSLNNSTPEETVLPNATSGHEIILRWWYDHDGVYIAGDGSLNSAIEEIKKNYERCLKSTEQLQKERDNQ